MRRETCFDTFKRALLTRTKHPLPFGRYKLSECCGRLEQVKQELDSISDLVTGRGDKWSLSHCVSWDKYIWLRGIPNVVAWHLAYEVLPGLLALNRDGVSQAEIDLAYPSVEKRIQDLLPRLESVRVTILRRIGIEYGHMKLNRPLLKPLVEEALAIAHQALALHSHARSKGSCV